MNNPIKKTVKYTKKDLKNANWHYQIGYFAEHIDEETARYLTDLIFMLKSPFDKMYIRFNLPDKEDMDAISANQTDWTYLFNYEETGKWLGVTTKYQNAVGFCESPEQAMKILVFVWNRCFEGTVLVVLSKEIHKDSITETEPLLLTLYHPLVIVRGHDGQWIDIYCKKENCSNLEKKILELNMKYGIDTEKSSYL